MAPTDTPKTRIWLRIGIVLVIVLLVGLWARSLSSTASDVRVASVSRHGLTATSSTNGIVEPKQEFEAHAPISTVVKAIYVKEGDTVHTGQLLLSLDDASAQSSLAQAASAVKGAQAALAQLKQGGTRADQFSLASQTTQAQAERDSAARDLTTVQSLAARGDASASEVQAARLRLDNAQSALELDRQRKSDPYLATDLAHAESSVTEAQAAYSAAASVVQKCNVHAPYSGTVFSLQVHTTQFVQAGDKMLELADLSQLQVRAYFDEPELGKLAVGQSATFKWAAKPDMSWHGHIIQMPSTIVHYGTRNVGEVVLSVDDSNGVLLSATNVTVTVTTTQHNNALVIPREALRLDGRGNYVYLIRNNRLQRANVVTAAVNVSEAEIATGLDSGDQVVLDATDGSPLKDGMSVHMVNGN